MLSWSFPFLNLTLVLALSFVGMTFLGEFFVQNISQGLYGCGDEIKH